VVHENLKAALLVRMKSGESKADLLARMKPDEGDELQPNPTIIDDAQVHIYGDTGVVIVRAETKKVTVISSSRRDGCHLQLGWRIGTGP
jgi:hypothetical protein